MRHKNDLLWKIRRIKKMSMEEVIFQINKRVRRLRKEELKLTDMKFINSLLEVDEELKQIKQIYKKKADVEVKKALKSYYLNRNHTKYLWNANQKAEYREGLNLFEHRLKEIGNKLLDRKFDFFANKNVSIDQEINWHKDYINNVCWEKDYKTYLSVEKNAGDVKNVWELNRFYHFVDLSKMIFLYSDDRCRADLKKQFYSWVEDNPFNYGVNWKSALEVSIRAINWITAMFYFLDEQTDEDFFFQYIKEIYKHGVYLEKNLTMFALPNNHLIGEAAGLVIIGILFPEFDKSKKWVKQGLKVLEEEFEKEIYNDGVSMEQSINYHRFVMDFYILVYRLCNINNIEFNIDICKFKKMFEFLNSVTDQKGRVPKLGDFDEGRGLYLSKIHHDDYKEIIMIGNQLLDIEMFEKTKEYETIIWMFGTNKASISSNDNAILGSKYFNNSGYMVMHNGVSKMVYYAGNQVNSEIVGHGHADIFTFDLAYKGDPFIIDSGTYRYNGDITSRNYFRSTLAHNTISVNRENQTKILEKFKWVNNPFPAPKTLNYKLGKYFDYITGIHNGYENVRHQRTMINLKSYCWIIIDNTVSSNENEYTLSYIIDPEKEIELRGNIFIMKGIENKLYNYIISKSINLMLKDIQVSDYYGKKVKSKKIEAIKNGKNEKIISILGMTEDYTIRENKDILIMESSKERIELALEKEGFVIIIKNQENNKIKKLILYNIMEYNGEEKNINIVTPSKDVVVEVEYFDKYIDINTTKTNVSLELPKYSTVEYVINGNLVMIEEICDGEFVKLES